MIEKNGPFDSIYFYFCWPKIIELDRRLFESDIGGPLLDLGIYGLTTFKMLLGSKSKFESLGNIHKFDIIDGIGGKVENDVDIDLKYSGDVTCRLETTMDADGDGKSWCKIKFKNGYFYTVKDIVHPHRNMDKNKFIVLRDKNNNIVDC
jgi:hypothetical protein